MDGDTTRAVTRVARPYCRRLTIFNYRLMEPIIRVVYAHGVLPATINAYMANVTEPSA